jgi:hypothetical protein
MGEHRDESLMDKVKNALGMGDHDDATTHGATDGEREGDWGGVGQTMDDRATDATVARPGEEIVIGSDVGATNRPAGPDYAGEDETTLTGAGTSEWSRGEAASGQSPFGEGDELEERPR